MQTGNLQGLINGTEQVVFDYEVGDSYTKLMLHMDGTDGSATIVDSCKKTVTATGSAFLRTAQRKFGSASCQFDGSTSYLQVPYSKDWYYGTDPFTIDLWVNFSTVAGNQYLYSQSDTLNPQLNEVAFAYSPGVLSFYNYTNSGGVTISVATAFTPVVGRWYHLAVCRIDSGNTAASWRIFVDGVAQSIYLAAGSWNASFADISYPITIGANHLVSPFGPRYFFNGYLDEYRISKGIARWTSNFTPATSAYICDPVDSISTGNILNGDEDGWYTIFFRLVSSAANSYVLLKINGDSTASYGYKGFLSRATSLVDDSGSGMSAGTYLFDATNQVGECGFVVATLCAKSGQVRLVDVHSTFGVSGTTIYAVYNGFGVWSNTTDVVKSINFVNLVANGFGVGTRAIVLKHNNFSKGVRTGSLSGPTVKGSWVRVGYKKLDADANSLAFDNLDGDRDVVYLLTKEDKQPGVNYGVTNLTFNTDTGVSYGMQYHQATGATFNSGRNASMNGLQLAVTGSLASNHIMSSTIIFAKRGFPRLAVVKGIDDQSSTAFGTAYISGGSWSNTSDPVNKIVLTKTVSNWLAGSKFELYALRPNG